MVLTRSQTRRNNILNNGAVQGLLNTVIPYAVGRAGQYAMNRIGTYAYNRITGGNRTARQTYSGLGITRQKDISRQYRKRSMPRGKKRRWRKFVKKVHAVNEKEMGSNTIVRNANLAGVSPINAQDYMAVVLYGNKGLNFAQDVGNDDIATVWNADNRLGTNYTAKAKFTAAVLDITLRSSTDPEEPEAKGADLEVDIYDVAFYDRTNARHTHEMFEQAQTQTTNITAASGTNVNLTMQNRGVTPFDLPMAIKAGKVKILKKTKVFLPVGATTTYQYRDAKTHIIGYNDTWDDSGGFIKPGVTHGVIIVHKPVVGSTEDGFLIAGVTRTYRYIINQDNKTFDAVRV